MDKELEALMTFKYIITRCKEEDSYIIKFPLGVQKGTTFGEDMEKAYKVLEQTLLKAQEMEKELAEYKETLRIIFEKKIDVNNFQTSLMVMRNFTYRYYINNSRDYHTCIMVELLTEEEFDLLKGWSEK